MGRRRRYDGDRETMDQSDHRRELIDRYASTHSAHFEPRDAAWYAQRSRFFHHRVAAFLPDDPEAPILDAACGAGELIHYLLSRGRRDVEGVDLSAEQIAQARASGLTNVRQADVFEHLEASPGRYQLILASHVVEHLSKAEIVRCLRLMRDALRAGGRILVLTPNAGSPLGLAYSFGDFTHETHFTAMSLAQVAALADLSVVHLGGIRPDPAGLRGRVRRILWDHALAPVLGALLGDGRMRYGRVMEPELIGVFTSPPG
jgi:2-polyprenyl-3-methyl-5-hydroxy-6-metoxy-1,4-benzoquinol methylase